MIGWVQQLVTWLFTNRFSATRYMEENGNNKNFEKDLAIFCK